MTGHVYILNRGRKSAVLYFYDLNTFLNNSLICTPKIYVQTTRFVVVLD